jgi:hypothetical protein
VPYLPPGPPINLGLHRYSLLLFRQERALTPGELAAIPQYLPFPTTSPPTLTFLNNRICTSLDTFFAAYFPMEVHLAAMNFFVGANNDVTQEPELLSVALGEATPALVG